jgi:hypothetical protein
MAAATTASRANGPVDRDVNYLDLPAEDAVLRGRGARQDGQYMAKIKDWRGVETTLAWQISVPCDTEVDVAIVQACADGMAGGTFEVRVGGAMLAGTVQDTGEWKRYKTQPLGKLKLAKGGHEVVLAPVKLAGVVLMDFDKLVFSGPGMRTATRADYKLPVPYPRDGKAVVVEDRGVPHNTLSAEEKAEGFRLIFDGQSTTGWIGYRQDHVPGKWSVEHGTLHFAGGGPGEGGNLMTLEAFADFEARLEWRLEAKGNSGIMIRASEDKNAPFENAVEMQALDAAHNDGKSLFTSAGACYAIYPTDPGALRPACEWNEVRIIARGTRHEFFLNGRKTAEFDTASDDWHDKLRQTKFHRWPGFGANRSGHLVLQDHGDPAWYRNIRVKRL